MVCIACGRECDACIAVTTKLLAWNVKYQISCKLQEKNHTDTHRNWMRERWRRVTKNDKKNNNIEMMKTSMIRKSRVWFFGLSYSNTHGFLISPNCCRILCEMWIYMCDCMGCVTVFWKPRTILANIKGNHSSFDLSQNRIFKILHSHADREKERWI